MVLLVEDRGDQPGILWGALRAEFEDGDGGAAVGGGGVAGDGECEGAGVEKGIVRLIRGHFR